MEHLVNPAGDGALRAGVASFVLAGGSAISGLLAERSEEARTLRTVGSALALAAAVFAAAGIIAAGRLGAPEPLPATPQAPGPAVDAAALARARGLLSSIAQTAAAGTLGDGRAAEYAFATIVREAAEASELLARIEFGSGAV